MGVLGRRQRLVRSVQHRGGESPTALVINPPSGFLLCFTVVPYRLGRRLIHVLVWCLLSSGRPAASMDGYLYAVCPCFTSPVPIPRFVVYLLMSGVHLDSCFVCRSQCAALKNCLYCVCLCTNGANHATCVEYWGFGADAQVRMQGPRVQSVLSQGWVQTGGVLS